MHFQKIGCKLQNMRNSERRFKLPTLNLHLPQVPSLEGDDYFNEEVKEHMDLWLAKNGGAHRGDRHYQAELRGHIRELNTRGTAAVDMDPNSRTGKVSRVLDGAAKGFLGKTLDRFFGGPNE